MFSLGTTTKYRTVNYPIRDSLNVRNQSKLLYNAHIVYNDDNVCNQNFLEQQKAAITALVTVVRNNHTGL